MDLRDLDFETEWQSIFFSTEELEWQDRALCREVDAELFFPEEGVSAKDAKSLCVTCDVRVECLSYAIGNREQNGVWGGMIRKERRQFARTHSKPYSLDEVDTALAKIMKKRR